MRRIKLLPIASMAAMLILTYGCEKSEATDSATTTQKKTSKLSEVETLQQKAEAGDADAMCRLGGLFIAGKGVDRDLEKGMLYIRKAAEQGVPFAQYTMGSAYMGVTYEGETLPCEIDIEKGVNWHKKAANKGFEASQAKLIEMYFLDDQNALDATETLKLLRSASTAQHPYIKMLRRGLSRVDEIRSLSSMGDRWPASQILEQARSLGY